MISIPHVPKGSWWSDGRWIYAISAYHHQRCEFHPRSRRCVIDTTLCDKFCQWLATGRWFSLGTPVSSTNETDRHWHNWNVVESGVNHHKPNQTCLSLLDTTLCYMDNVISYLQLVDVFLRVLELPQSRKLTATLFVVDLFLKMVLNTNCTKLS